MSAKPTQHVPRETLIFTVTNDLTYDQRMSRICGTLAERYAVRLIGRERPNSSALEAKPYEQVRLKCLFDRGKLFYAEYNLRLLFYLLTHRFALACAIDLDTILPCFVASRLRRRPLVYDAHEIFTEIPELTGRPFVRRVWLAIERALVPRVRFAYTVNESLARIFHERYGSRFEVIRNVPPLRPTPEAPRRERCIFYQGVLNVGRGLEALVEAMAQIDANLVFAGEGDISSELRESVRRLGLGGRVEFLGYVLPAQLAAVTREATIAVNLRERLGLNDYYSLGNKFFDSMHAGVPQITMNFPEYAAINARHEVAVLVGDLSEATLREAIHRLLDDRAFYERLRANCRAASEAYNWGNESERLLAFYEKVLGGSAEG